MISETQTQEHGWWTECGGEDWGSLDAAGLGRVGSDQQPHGFQQENTLLLPISPSQQASLGGGNPVAAPQALQRKTRWREWIPGRSGPGCVAAPRPCSVRVQPG